MKALFWSVEAWHAGIAAAVREGLTFEAFEPGSGCTTWEINYTGGY